MPEQPNSQDQSANAGGQENSAKKEESPIEQAALSRRGDMANAHKEKSERQESPRYRRFSLTILSFRLWRQKRKIHRRERDWRVTDVVIALFTVVIAVATIAQGFIAYYSAKAAGVQTDKLICANEEMAKAGQDQVKAVTKQMRTDQRAWLKQSDLPAQLLDNDPIRIPSELANTGKTPAEHIDGYLVLTLLDRNRAPDFLYGPDYHGYHISAGILFQGGPSIQVPYDALRTGKRKEPPATIVFDADTKKALNDGTSYVAMYGKITYDDVFGISHWLTFCDVIRTTPKIFDMTQAQKTCVDYTNVDDN